MAAAAGDMPEEEEHSRLNQRREEQICEANVTLGRLGHVKACHGETSELMVQSLADAGAGRAVETAMAKVRFDYENLKENLEKLYRKSMADLHTHKMNMEAPTRARVELVVGQQKAVDNAEEKLKALMAHPDMGILTRELPHALRRANRVLRSSIKLIGLRLPEVKPVTAEDFPPGRLHNVIIAPKRSGQRDWGQSQPRTRAGSVRKRSPSTKQPLITLQEEDEVEQRAWPQRPPTPLRSLSSSSLFSDDRDGSLSSQSHSHSLASASASAAAAVAPGDEVATAAVVAGAVAAAAAAEAEARGAAEEKCCRNGQSSRPSAPAGWDDERGKELGDVGDAPLGVATEACSHCACACRADDVWAAYRTLRKRYHALKDQADQEEVRMCIEEKQREVQSELERQKLEMQAELDRKKLEMEAEFEKKKRAMQADINGGNSEAEPVAPAAASAPAAAASSEEGVLALSQEEVKSLREIVHASLEESKAMQRESSELRQKVALGEECLQEALKEALSLREEITKRKQHGEVLLARIRFLKGQTSAHVKNIDWGAEEGWGGMGTAAAVRPQSEYGSDSALNSVTNQGGANAGARQPKPTARRRRPRRLDSGTGAPEDDALRRAAFRRSRSEADIGHDNGGYQSPQGKIPRPTASARRQRPRRLDSGIDASEDAALRHPAFPPSPSKVNGHDAGGYQPPPGELQPEGATRRQRPRHPNSNTGASEGNAFRHPAFPRSPAEAIDHARGGYQSPPPGELPEPKAAARPYRPPHLDSEVGASENDALRHPVFPRSPSEANGYQSSPGELPRARDAPGVEDSWIERAGRPMPGPWTDWDGGEDEGGGELNGDAKARHLEREREHLTREVYRLSAQLDASGVTSTSSRLGPSELDEGLSSRSFATSASVPVDVPAPPAGSSRRRDEAAAAAAEAEEAAAMAIAAADRFSRTEVTMSPRDKRLRARRGYDSGDDGGNVGKNDVPSNLRRTPFAPSMSVPDASTDDSDGDSITSGASGRSSPSWGSIARRRQHSLLAEEVFSRLPPRQRQRRERHEEAVLTKARRMSGRATEAATLWGRGAGGSDSDTASEKVLSEGSAGDSSDSSASRYSSSLW